MVPTASCNLCTVISCFLTSLDCRLNIALQDDGVLQDGYIRHRFTYQAIDKPIDKPIGIVRSKFSFTDLSLSIFNFY